MVPIASAVDQAHGQADHPAVDLDLHDLSSHFSSERVDQPMENVRRMAQSGRRQEATGGLAPTESTTPDVATLETCSSEAALVAPATRPIRSQAIGQALRRFFADQPTLLCCWSGDTGIRNDSPMTGGFPASSAAVSVAMVKRRQLPQIPALRRPPRRGRVR